MVKGTVRGDLRGSVCVDLGLVRLVFVLVDLRESCLLPVRVTDNFVTFIYEIIDTLMGYWIS